MSAGDPRSPASSGNPVLVEVRGVAKTFGHVRALGGVDLDVREGEVLALVGDNGAGKSTLVNVISGALKPDAGSVTVAGMPLDLGSIEAAAALGIATVYQDLALAPDLTVAENVFLARERKRPGLLGRLGFTDDLAMAAETTEVMRSLGIETAAESALVQDLSGGQRQVVALSRAVLRAGRLIIMDEPTAALGAKQSQIVLDTIESATTRGLSILLVSHDLPRVIEAADRIAVLRHGHMVAELQRGEASVPLIVGLMLGQTESATASAAAPLAARWGGMP
jgi:ABC-type sugar transport system ATPase subunit